MSISPTREKARPKVIELVHSFKANEAAYINPASHYNETEVRTQFIVPFFQALGWDVLNKKRLPLDLREVIQEATVEVGTEKLSKKPDYEFRLARQRKFFVEAKKPSIKIESDNASAFQTRRYGFSAGLPVSILTNFHKLAIYDCVPVPGKEDNPRKARLKLYSYEELESCFDELYDTLSRVEASVLGDIYELLIAQELVLDNRNNLTLVEKPEVIASGGIFTTPKYIVDSIVERTLAPAISGKTPAELASIHIADICCGSGVFLLAAYDFSLNYHLNWYLKDGAAKHNGREIYEIGQGEWRLTLNQKRKILLNNIFGVDIEGQAVEVARFSLLLKLIEDETNESIVNHLSYYKEQALPALDNHIKCGNSLVSPLQFQSYNESADDALLELINPFDWEKEFPAIFNKGGFDIVIGNPPYIRIQNMVVSSPEEVKFYQSSTSGYTCAESDNFDKYALFIERAVSLLNQKGFLGYIVPHKFFAIKSGQNLRKLISNGRHLNEIVYFGVQQVFGKRSTTYTCILILAKSPNPEFSVEIVDDLKTWRYSELGIKQSHPSEELDEKPWTFIQDRAKLLFDRLRREHPLRLETVAEIFVGVQTSADKIYIIHPTKIATNTVSFIDVKGKKWTIERDILRPSLLDSPLYPFCKPEPNTFIIFPYKIKNNDAELYSPDEMRKLFPKAWKYLNAHKSKLMDRNIQGGTADSWYRYGRSQSLTKFNSEKIILPILSTDPRYAYDDRNIVVTGGGNGPYYLIRPRKDTHLSIFFILAVLCHPLIEAMVRASSSAFRGGYYSHGKQFLESLPIPDIDFTNASMKNNHDQIVSLSKKLIAVNERIKSSTIPKQRNVYERQRLILSDQINKLVEALYGLSPTDLKAAESVQIPT
ncbi:MAG: Eco57I restriction-modification methylase domain-containing protein [Candidatus Brocadiaceae bacterium]|nr:Eco57I restriction-modification methylase domain-containing protein [Candidatus Brocadiaceae bacterium]